MRYYICGITITGSHFWVNDVAKYELDEEKNKVVATVSYFGGGSVTVYKTDYDNKVTIDSFINVDENVVPIFPVDNN